MIYLFQRIHLVRLYRSFKATDLSIKFALCYPTAPISLRVAAGTKQSEICWNTPSSSPPTHSYVINYWRKEKPDILSTDNVTVTSLEDEICWTLINLRPETSYEVEIRGYDENNNPGVPASAEFTTSQDCKHFRLLYCNVFKAAHIILQLLKVGRVV